MVRDALGTPTIDAAVARTLAIFNGVSEGSGHFLVLDLSRKAGFGNARNDSPITDGSLNEPVIVSVAGDTSLNACLTKIEIALLTDAAVVVLVGDAFTTVVAVDAECAGREVVEGRKRSLAELGRACGCVGR